MISLNEIWACEESKLLAYLDLRLNAKFETSAFLDFKMPTAPPILKKVGSTAFIDIRGIMSNSEPDILDMLLGVERAVYGRIIEAINAVAQDDKIKNVQLNMNTPGGEVLGGDEVAMAVAMLAGLKPVRVVNEGMIASMGYWIASQASEILATSPANMTGSIGVVITAVDDSAEATAAGVKKVTVASRNAPNKVLDLDTPEGVQVLEDRANAAERVFMDRIASGRGVSLDKIKSDFGKGGVLIARDPDTSEPDAIRSGMIDGLINITTQTNEKTGGLEMTASIDRQTNQEVSNMSEKNEVVPTAADIAKVKADAEANRQEAIKTERERLQAIEALNAKFAGSHVDIRTAVRAKIDAVKFDEGATAGSVSVTLLDVVAEAQAKFAADASKPGRDAAKLAEEIAGAKPNTENEAEAVASKERVAGLAAGMKEA